MKSKLYMQKLVGDGIIISAKSLAQVFSICGRSSTKASRLQSKSTFYPIFLRRIDCAVSAYRFTYTSLKMLSALSEVSCDRG